MNDCYLYAVKLLTKKDYSEQKLRMKLNTKGFSTDEINESIISLTNRRFLNQDRYSLDLAISLLKRGYGPSLIIERLQNEGLNSTQELIDQAYDKLQLTPQTHLKTLLLEQSNSAPAKIYKHCISKGHDPELVESFLHNLTD